VHHGLAVPPLFDVLARFAGREEWPSRAVVHYKVESSPRSRRAGRGGHGEREFRRAFRGSALGGRALVGGGGVVVLDHTPAGVEKAQEPLTGDKVTVAGCLEARPRRSVGAFRLGVVLDRDPARAVVSLGVGAPLARCVALH
jgi:hypothetical protein